MEELIERYAKVPRQQRFLGFAVVVLAVIALYWFFVHSSVTSQVQDLRGQKNSFERKRVDQTKKKKDLKLYETKLRELEDELSRARAQLPDSADVAQLISQLGNKGRQSGLLLNRIEPQPEVSKGFYAEIPFNVSLEGSYHEIATFIDSLGKLERIVNVSNISMTQPKLENSKMVLKSNLQVKTYRYANDSGGKKK